MTTIESKFSGGLLGYVWVNGLYFASIIFTAGLMLPFAMCYRERWVAKHTTINGKQLEFFGRGRVLFLRKVVFLIFGPILIAAAVGLFFRWFGDSMGGDGDLPIVGMALLPLITAILFALFTAWLSLRMKKWIVRHTRIVYS
ncbi:MAG: YjgN family protein [Firmicutes bacterium]|nr:YjgN family protein [Bacillota bacterium]